MFLINFITLLKSRIEKKTFYSLILCVFVLYPSFSIQAQSKALDSSWSDLERDSSALFGSSKDEKYSVNALIVSIEDWDNHYSLGAFFLFRYTNYPNFTSHSLFPLYGVLDSKNDDRYRNTVFPLYYYVTNGPESSLLTPLSWSYRDNDKSEVQDLFTLFYRHHVGEDRFYSLFPLVFYGRDDEQDSGFFTLFPVFSYDYKSCNNKGSCLERSSTVSPLFYSENIEDTSTYFLSWLGYYDYTYRNDESTTLILPLLFYRHTVADEQTEQLTGLFYYSNDERDSSGSFNILPLFYSDWDKDSSSNMLFPLYSYESDKTDTTFKSILGYYDYEEKNDETTTLVWPLLFYRHTVADEQTEQLTGLFYYSNDERDSSGSFNILPLFYSDWGKDSSSNMLFPLYSYTGNTKGSSFYSILFGWDRFIESKENPKETLASMNYSLLHYYNDSPKESYFHLFPLYYSYEDDKQLDTLFIPFFYSTSYETEAKSDFNVTHLLGYSRFYEDDVQKESGHEFLLLPIWYSSTDDSTTRSSTTMVNPLFVWDKSEGDIDGESYVDSSFWFPIVPIFYTSDDSEVSTTFLAGAWWQTDQKSNELTKLGLFPLYFADYRPDGYQHILPFLYFSFYDSTGSKDEQYTAYAPLHYHHRDGDRLTFWLGPYYTYSDESDKEFSDYLVPLYFSWQDKESKGNIFIPFYFEYEDEHKYFHVNLGGVSLGQEKIKSISIKSDGGAYHIDSEVGFLYNAFRIETRVTLFANEIEKIEKENEDFPEPVFDEYETTGVPSFRKKNNGVVNGPQVTRDLAKNRDNSNTFWGLSAFFGLVSYEKADTHRHFRILPLSWLSWDEADDEKVNFLFAAYASYQGKDSKYLAIFPAFFPLYGYQEDKDYRVDAFAAILYIREHDQSTDYTEHSILWPIINVYSSPEKSGFRIFPLVWHNREYQTSLNNEKKLERGELTKSSTSALLFYDRYNKNESWQTFIPLYYSQTKTREVSKDVRREESLLVGLPFLYSDSTRHFDDEGNAVAHQKDESTLFFPGYYQKRKAKHKKDSLLFGFVSFGSGYENNINVFPDQDPISSEISLLFGILDFSSKSNGSGGSWFFPIYYYDNEVSTYKRRDGSHREESTIVGLPLFYYYTQDSLDEDGNRVDHASDSSSLFVAGYQRNRRAKKIKHSFLFGLFSSESKYKENIVSFPDQDSASSQTSFLYGLADFKSNDKGESSSWVFPLYYYDSDKEESSWGFPVLPVLYYHNSNSDGTRSTTWVPLMYWHDEPNYKSRLFANVWYSHKEKSDETSFHIWPVFWSWHEPEEKSFLIPGAYLAYDNKGNFQSLLGIVYWRERTYSNNRTEHCIALCIISLDTRETKWDFEILGGILGAEGRYDRGYEFNLLWIGVDHKYDKRFRHNFLPLWYYNRDIDDGTYDYVAPALLSWGEKNVNSGSHYWMLGILYWNKYNEMSRSEVERVLLGALWHDIRKPELGYRSRGMLWGFLWEYETEDDTDFRKFTILKGLLYSYKRKDGVTTNGILGGIIKF